MITQRILKQMKEKTYKKTPPTTQTGEWKVTLRYCEERLNFTGRITIYTRSVKDHYVLIIKVCPSHVMNLALGYYKPVLMEDHLLSSISLFLFIFSPIQVKKQTYKSLLSLYPENRSQKLKLLLLFETYANVILLFSEKYSILSLLNSYANETIQSSICN